MAAAMYHSCRCPPGYTMGRLELHHSDLVRSTWTITQESMWIQQKIESLKSIAIYHKESPTQPVSWLLEFPHREMGHGYTVEAHRKKGLGSLALIAFIQSLLKDCPDIPPLGTIEERYIMDKMIESLGFVQSGYMAYSV